MEVVAVSKINFDGIPLGDLLFLWVVGTERFSISPKVGIQRYARINIIAQKCGVSILYVSVIVMILSRPNMILFLDMLSASDRKLWIDVVNGSCFLDVCEFFCAEVKEVFMPLARVTNA